MTTLRFTVTDDDTAAALGSGSLPVLGTPRLLAWCEAATCAAIEPELGEGETSVGTRVELEHTRGVGVGIRIEVTASPVFRSESVVRRSVSGLTSAENPASSHPTTVKHAPSTATLSP